MASLNEVSEIVGRAAAAALNTAALKVHSELATSSDGQDALHISIVYDSNDIARMSGDTALAILVKVRHQLLAAGEQRVPSSIS